MNRIVAALVIALLLGSCAKGSEAVFPSTRRGWGIVVIVVGAAWIVTSAAIAADGDLGTGKRVGYPVGAAAIGGVLIYGGYKLGDFGGDPPPPTKQPSARQ